MEDARVAQLIVHARLDGRFQLTMDVWGREFPLAHLPNPADAHQVRHVGGVLAYLARTMSGK
jgi:hypothetical protein